VVESLVDRRAPRGGFTRTHGSVRLELAPGAGTVIALHAALAALAFAASALVG
jgi:hypothetical protein